MFIQQLSISINSNANPDEVLNDLNILLSHYRGNGQIQGKIESQYIFENKIVTLPFSIEEDSISERYNNSYVSSQQEKLKELCNSDFEYQTLGKYNSDYTGGCTCSRSDFFILETNYLSIESPIKCGTCYKQVALYKLPHYYDHRYMPILRWESNYISCDRLQMNGEVGEHWAMDQMENPDSELSKQGREICYKLSGLTNTPVYYYLYNYHRYAGNSPSRTCPYCGGKWALGKILHNRYDFKCNTCNIISEISPNSADYLSDDRD